MVWEIYTHVGGRTVARHIAASFSAAKQIEEDADRGFLMTVDSTRPYSLLHPPE